MRKLYYEVLLWVLDYYAQEIIINIQREVGCLKQPCRSKHSLAVYQVSDSLVELLNETVLNKCVHCKLYTTRQITYISLSQYGFCNKPCKYNTIRHSFNLKRSKRAYEIPQKRSTVFVTRRFETTTSSPFLSDNSEQNVTKRTENDVITSGSL